MAGKTTYVRIIKPVLDVAAASLILAAISPLFFLIMICLSFRHGHRVFYTQQRPGKDGRIFRIIKFKTMDDTTDAEGNLLPEEERITKFGRLLRASSLNELPQFINVIKRDMSIIGPRPLLPQYLPLYTQEQRHRHDVLPGITGWAQINGRNKISWSEKFKLDLWYVDHVSFTLDIKIFRKTLLKSLTKEGIIEENPTEIEYFNGSN